MNDILVAYTSKHGGTTSYIDLLAQELAFDVTRLENLTRNMKLDYRVILLASGVYAGKVAAAEWLLRHGSLLDGKRVLILAVGASERSDELEEQLAASNLGDDPHCEHLFYARGAFDERRLSLPEKLLCRALRASIKGKDPEKLDPSMRALAQIGTQPMDWTDRRYIEPLIEALG